MNQLQTGTQCARPSPQMRCKITCLAGSVSAGGLWCEANERGTGGVRSRTHTCFAQGWCACFDSSALKAATAAHPADLAERSTVSDNSIKWIKLSETVDLCRAGRKVSTSLECHVSSPGASRPSASHHQLSCCSRASDIERTSSSGRQAYSENLNREQLIAPHDADRCDLRTGVPRGLRVSVCPRLRRRSARKPPGRPPKTRR